MKHNKLAVPESDSFMEQYKEEYANEFGIHHSVQEQDAKAKNMTKSMMFKAKKQDKEDK
ncbi:small, acid-soluble spore protein, alpha/beta type [Bacillus sp. FJAT-45037]|uniref:small, acid-soluble spore protein, alpha/beta type n=1 Tax=Bacillus sp. FJAT-45037 TaxID=2011007 RepID=UPI0012FE6CF0|nr:small, acid-soluble spore protein, alpha/beta type [Bacillus sp. FJAT-45037]